MGFEIDNWVTIKHLNIRKQGNEDERELAIDVKCMASGVPANALCPLLGVDSDAAIERAFFDGENVAFSGITEIASWAEFTSGHTILIAGHEFVPDALKKFKFTPRYDNAPLADVEFQFTVNGPQRELVQYLTENVAEEIMLAISSEPEFDFGEAAA